MKKISGYIKLHQLLEKQDLPLLIFVCAYVRQLSTFPCDLTDLVTNLASGPTRLICYANAIASVSGHPLGTVSVEYMFHLISCHGVDYTIPSSY